MKNPKKIITDLLLHIAITLMVLLCHSAFPQAGNAGNYTAQTHNNDIDLASVYRIELLIFADVYREYQHSEAWPAQTALGYPEELIFISEPKNIKDTTDSLQSKVTALAFELGIKNPAVNTDSFSKPESINQTSNGKNLAEADHEQDTESKTLNKDEPVSVTEQKPELVLPQLMVNITEKPSLLGSVATTLKRRSRYQVLFHQSWYQSLQSKKAAPAIPVHGGEQYDDHYQLSYAHY